MSKFNNSLAKIAISREQGTSYSMYDVETIARDLGHFTDIKLEDVAGESLVFSAKDPGLKSKVAVKVMLPVAPEKKSIFGSRKRKVVENISETKRRFIRSIQMQRIVHQIVKEESLENVCCVPMVIREIYKTLSGVECFAFVMEYVEHTKLIDWCESRTSDLDILKLFGNMVVSMMHCMHSRSIIHTDLKPSNVLVASDRPCFIDFGCAKNLSSKNQITTIKTVEMHSGVYSSQRQIAFPNLRGYYEDVYSLGILLWCMLSRSFPIDDDTEKRRELLFPKAMLPREWQQFFECCVDEENKTFPTIVEMYQEFDRIYKDYRAIVVKGNNIGPIDKATIMESLRPENRNLGGAFLDVLNNILGGQNEEDY